MADRKIHNHLSGQRIVIVVLRLVIDKSKKLLYGEIIDAKGKVYRRFLTYDEMENEIEECLKGIEGIE